MNTGQKGMRLSIRDSLFMMRASPGDNENYCHREHVITRSQSTPHSPYSPHSPILTVETGHRSGGGTSNHANVPNIKLLLRNMNWTFMDIKMMVMNIELFQDED
jgi:hypothetical protein